MLICHGNSADGFMDVIYCFSCLFQLLDEVQSYIVVERFIEHNSAAADSTFPEFLHTVSISVHLAIHLYNIAAVFCFIVYTKFIQCSYTLLLCFKGFVWSHMLSPGIIQIKWLKWVMWSLPNFIYRFLLHVYCLRL